ncbi:MAG: sigma-54 dependent transcriptional regulator [Acidobacteriota bacterium]
MDEAKALRDAGRFREALAILRDTASIGVVRRSTDVLRAELLERLGQYEKSSALAESLLRGKGLSPSERSSCELVLARVNIEHGHSAIATAQLQRAVTLALEGNDQERACWAQLRLLLVLSDRSGPDSIASMLAELRSRVMNTGNSGIVAALHIHVSETEAKRGLLRNARRHLEMGRRGLASSGNRWLEALVENVACAVETMCSNFVAANTHARTSLDIAEDAGASSIRESALGNLGHLAYLAGRFDEAYDFLTRARTTRRGSDTWVGCLDTLARIHLAQDHIANCARVLDEIESEARESGDQARFVYRHAQMTRAVLLARQGDIDGALRQIEFVIGLATRAKDEFFGNIASLSKADFLQEAGRLDECGSILRDLMLSIPQQPPDFSAHYERVLACATVRAGQMGAGDCHRRRSARIFGDLQHHAGALELANAWERACSNSPNAEIDSDEQFLSPSSALHSVASLTLHVGRPILIATELIDLLGKTGSVWHAAAEARGTDGVVETLAETGEPERRCRRGGRRVAIGKAGERDVSLVLTPKDDLESIATVNAIGLIVATLRDLECARAEREERATLWPIDELPADGDGAVTVGHMREVITFAKKIAHANIGVLITGESGTGKEVVARAIHTHSSRAKHPFVPFNCAAIPREMLESQLFGHRRGAFTGADRDNPGVIRSARDGTLFLDEVGELSLELQPKLLRFLESGEICPLGESAPFVVDVRIVAATNSKLEALVKEGRFREDLFYRLNIVRLSLRPLRERRDEIPTLVSNFLMRASEEFRKTHVRISEEAMERLVLYEWPGNVRQLQNEIRRIVAIAESHSVLATSLLSPDIGRAREVSTPSTPPAGGREIAVGLTNKLNTTLAQVEREMIKVALREHHGRVDAAARALGISRKGLYLKRHRLGL